MYDEWIGAWHKAPQSLGRNIEMLLGLLRSTNPLLADFLVDPSVQLAERLAGTGVVLDAEAARQLYGNIFDALEREIRESGRQLPGIRADEELRVRCEVLAARELVADRDACLLATMGIERGIDESGRPVQTVVFAGHQVLWDRLRNNGPPAGFTLAEFLAALARHEICEYVALAAARPDPERAAAHPWLADFDAYLAQHALPRTAASFHAYLRTLTSLDVSHPIFKQTSLLDSIDAFLDAPIEIDLAEYPKFDRAQLAGLDNAVLRGYRFGTTGKMTLGGTIWCRSDSFGGRVADVTVRDGIVTGLRFPDDGSTVLFTLIRDNRTGRITDSFMGKLPTRKRESLQDATVLNYLINGVGGVDIGGHRWGRFEARAGEYADVTFKDGIAHSIHFLADDTILELALIVDNATGAVTDAFPGRLVEEKLKTLRDSTIRGYSLSPGGELEFGGRHWGRFEDRPGGKVDVVIKEGVVVRVIFPDDGTAEDFVQVVDNTTGTLIDSFQRRVNFGRIDAQADITIRNLSFDVAGYLTLNSRIWKRNEARANETVDVVLKDGVVTKLRYVVDGTEEDFALIIDNESGAVVDSFGGRLPADKLQALHDATIRGYELSPGGALELGGRLWGQFADRPGAKVDLTVKDGAVAGITFPGGEQTKKFIQVIDNATGALVGTATGKPGLRGLDAMADVTVRHLVLDAIGNLLVNGRTWRLLGDRAGAAVDAVLENGVVTKLRYAADGSEEEFVLIVDNTTGAVTDSFAGRLSGEKLRTLDDVTIKGYPLDADGFLALGGRVWTRFAGRANEKADIAVKDGIVVRVTFVRDHVTEVFGQVIDNTTGRLVDSFLHGIHSRKIVRLPDATLRNAVLDDDGNVAVNRRAWQAGREHAGERVDAVLENGIVTKLRFSDGTEMVPEPVVEKPMGWNADKTFFWSEGPVTVVTDGAGRVLVDGVLVGTIRAFPDAEVDVHFEEGGAVKVTVRRDANGEPALDRNDSPLELALQGDLDAQVRANYLSPAERKRMALWQRYAGAQELFTGRHYDEAGRQFGEIAAGAADLPPAAASLLLRKAQYYAGVCRKILSSGRTKAPSPASSRVAPQVLHRFQSSIPPAEFARLDNVMVTGLRTGKNGEVYVGGKHWARFMDRPQEEIGVLVKDGCVVRVRFERDGREIGLSSIIDNASGRLLDSFNNTLNAEKLRQLDDATITNYTLNKKGAVKLGGRTWVQFNGRPEEVVDLVIRDGMVVGIRFHRDGTAAELISIIDNATGETVDTFFGLLPPKRLGELKDATIKGYQLADKGALSLGGRLWGTFEDRGNEKIDIRIRDGCVAGVTFPRDGAKIEFALIKDNRTGRIIDSYWSHLFKERLEQLDDVTISGVRLESRGSLNLGGRFWARFDDVVDQTVNVMVRDGLVTGVRFADGTEKKLSLICVGGKPVDSFYVWTDRIPDGDDVTIRQFFLDAAGNLHFLGKSPVRFSYYPHAEVELALHDRQVVGVLFVRDAVGGPIPDAHGDPLEIDLRGDTRMQMLEKSLLVQERRLADSVRSSMEGERLFLEGDYAAAVQAFVGIIIRMRSRKVPNFLEPALVEKARLYISACRRLMAEEKKKRDESAVEQDVLQRYRAAEQLFISGAYPEAMKAFRGVVRRAAAGSAMRTMAQKRIEDCRVNIFCSAGEELFEAGSYKDAMKKFGEILKRSAADGDVRAFAGARLKECGAHIGFLKADAQFAARKYRQALDKYKALLAQAEYGSDLYVAARQRMTDCKKKISENMAGRESRHIPLSIKHYYTQDTRLENDKEQELLAGIRQALAGGDDARANRLENILAESYIWVVKQGAGKRTSTEYEYYDELVNDGFLALYGIIEEYCVLQERGDAAGTLREFVKDRIGQHFDGLRKERNRHVYGEISIQKKLGASNSKDGEGVTLEALLPSGEASAEESVISEEEGNRLDHVLRQMASAAEREMVLAALEEGLNADEIAERMECDPDEVREVLSRALVMLRSAPALGSNLEQLVLGAVARLAQVEPHARLLAALRHYAGDLTRQLVALYRSGTDVSGDYAEYAAMLGDNEQVDAVEVWDSAYLLGEDAWSLAMIEVAGDGTRKLLVHRKFLDALKAQGPPAEFEAGLERGQREKMFLALLAQHESDEEIALRSGAAAPETLKRRPWIVGFDDYLAKNGLPRVSGSFHEYILSLERNGTVLSQEEKALAAQAALLSFAGRIEAARQKEGKPLQGKGEREFRIYDTVTGALVIRRPAAGQRARAAQTPYHTEFLCRFRWGGQTRRQVHLRAHQSSRCGARAGDNGRRCHADTCNGERRGR
jgi:RNA polymerase sigma factor (sigma-70 family)